MALIRKIKNNNDSFRFENLKMLLMIADGVYNIFCFLYMQTVYIIFALNYHIIYLHGYKILSIVTRSMYSETGKYFFKYQ